MPSTADDVLAEIRSAALRVAAVRLRRYGLDSLSVMRQWYYWPGDIPNDFVPLPSELHRFPPDFLFYLTEEAFESLRPQIATSKRSERRYVPLVFTRPHTSLRLQIRRCQERCRPAPGLCTAWICQRRWARPVGRRRVCSGLGAVRWVWLAPCQAAAPVALLRLVATTSRTRCARLPSASAVMNWESRASACDGACVASGRARRAAAS